MSVTVGYRQLLCREQADHLAAVVSNHDFLLNPRRRKSIAGRAVGLKREHHASLYLHRIVEADRPTYDRPLVQCQSQAMTELQAEG